MKKRIFRSMFLILLFALLRAEASMQRGYPQSKYCLDIEVRSGSTGQPRSVIAEKYPSKMEVFTNGSFFRKSTYARKHRRKATGWGAIGFHVYNSKEDTNTPSGHRRAVFVQSTIVKIGYWKQIKDSLPKVINLSTNEFEPYVLCAIEGNLIMKNGRFEFNNQGFSYHDRHTPHRRPIVAIKADQLLYLGYMYGSSKQIFRQLKRAGFLDAIALDSGSSTAPSAPVFDIVGIVSKKSTRYLKFETELNHRSNWTRLLKPRKNNKPAQPAPFGDIIFPIRTPTLSGSLVFWVTKKQTIFICFLWSGWSDSNRRPPRPKRGALAN